MDPVLARAQEQHTRLHNTLLAKDKQLAACEAKVASLEKELQAAGRTLADEKKRHQALLDEKELAFAERVAELEAREEALREGQTALAESQAQLEQDRTAAKAEVERMEAQVLEIETKNLALVRERDAALHTNATNLQRQHEQLILASQNYLLTANEDIERIATLRAESEQQKKDIATRFTEQLVQAARTEADLRAQLHTVQERANEDAARWAAQKTEFEAIIKSNAHELEMTLQRVKAQTAKEMAALNERIVQDATLLQSLQAWEATRAEKDAAWLASRDEAKFLRIELEKAIARYERLETSTQQTITGVRRELDATRAKLTETEEQLAKKTQALQVYHREIKNNAAKLEEIRRQKAAQEKAHREEQDRAAAKIVELGGKGIPPKESTISGVFSSLFKSDAQKKAEKDAAAAAQAQQQRKASLAEDASPIGPKRSIDGTSEEEANTLNEEMAVSLSRRVEALEEDRLQLTALLEQTRLKLKQAELLNQLRGQNDAAKDESAASSSSSSTPNKKGALGGLLSSKDAKSKDPLSDPARVRAMLEQSTLENQRILAESERHAAEAKRLKAVLEATKEDLAEARRKEKLASAAKKGQVKASEATGVPTPSPTPPLVAATSPTP